MGTYIFQKLPDANNSYDIATVEISAKTTYLPDILETFECFLKASGFALNGHVTIEEEPSELEYQEAAEELKESVKKKKKG